MTELPSWAAVAVEVFIYAVFGLPLIAYAAFGILVLIFLLLFTV